MKIKSVFMLVTMLMLSTTAFATNNDAVSVVLQTTKQTSNTSEVNILITNNTEKPLKVLTWNTPLEISINADIFNVTVDNKPVVYIGKLIKRGKPEDTDYIIFQPSESKLISVDLSNYYKMDKGGAYAVSYKGLIKFSLHDLNKSNLKTQLKQSKATSDVLNFNFTPSKKKSYAPKLTPNFDQCSTNQRDSINRAHNQAIKLLRVASSDMTNARRPTSARRYSEWFGSANITRQNTVLSHFNSILSALDSKQITFSCDCTRAIYAYVSPSQPYKIWLCPSFWNAPLAGTDSKAGTIIHETSHFNIVANTDDIEYGQSNARSLAISDPASAVRNADSHEYFAENKPFLPMDPVASYSISGRIADASTGIGLSGASVSITGPGISRTGSSNSTGLYSFSSLASGSYRVSASKVGYTTDAVNTTIASNNKVVNLNLIRTTTTGNYKIVLSWGATPRDLDSRLWVTSSASRGCFDLVNYSDRSELPYASLDIDDTSSYGPETITVFQVPASGSHEYWVHNFTGSPNMTTSGATVKVYRGSTLIRTFNIPQRTTDSSRYWHVFNLGRSGITSVNTLSATENPNCSGSTPPPPGNVINALPAMLELLLNNQ